MTFDYLPREIQIHLLDWEEDRDVKILYKVCTIPAKTRKVFTTNKKIEEMFSTKRKSGKTSSEDKAITRRIKVVELEGELWK